MNDIQAFTTVSVPPGHCCFHREYCEKTVKYAAACGYQALVLTVDTPVPGNREATYGDPTWAAALRSVYTHASTLADTAVAVNSYIV